MVPFQTLVSDISHLRLARSIIFKSDEAQTSCMGEYNSPTIPLSAFAYIRCMYVYIYIYTHTHNHPINGSTQNLIILVQLAPSILDRRRKKRNILRLQTQLCKHWMQCMFWHHTDMSNLLFDCYSSILWSTRLWHHAGRWVPMFLRTYCLPLHRSTHLPGHVVSQYRQPQHKHSLPHKP